MPKRLLLAAAGALVLSVVYVPATNAGSGAQECLARMGNEKMTAAEWTACACHGVTLLTDLHSLAQVAANKSDVCAGIASDRLVQLLAQPGAATAGGADDAVATDVIAKKGRGREVPLAAVRLRSGLQRCRAQDLCTQGRHDHEIGKARRIAPSRRSHEGFFRRVWRRKCDQGSNVSGVRAVPPKLPVIASIACVTGQTMRPSMARRQGSCRQGQWCRRELQG
jgi:hypothetical protein